MGEKKWDSRDNLSKFSIHHSSFISHHSSFTLSPLLLNSFVLHFFEQLNSYVLFLIFSLNIFRGKVALLAEPNENKEEERTGGKSNTRDSLAPEKSITSKTPGNLRVPGAEKKTSFPKSEPLKPLATVTGLSDVVQEYSKKARVVSDPYWSD